MVKDAKILILGVTFKENCPDIRNTKILDIYYTLLEYTSNITIFDPWANKEQVKHEYDVDVVSELLDDKYDACILAVAHKEFLELNVQSFVKEVVCYTMLRGYYQKRLSTDVYKNGINLLTRKRYRNDAIHLIF